MRYTKHAIKSLYRAMIKELVYEYYFCDDDIFSYKYETNETYILDRYGWRLMP